MLIQNQNRFPTASSAAQIYTRSRKDNRGYYGGWLTPFSLFLPFSRRNVNQLCDVNRFGWRDFFFFFFLVSRTMKCGKRRVLRNRIQGMEDGLAKIE